MKLLFNWALLLIASLALSACVGVPNTSSSEPKLRWVGVMAVQESPLVNQVLAEADGDRDVYYPQLRRLLDAGQIMPAPGSYAFVPYADGQPYEHPQRFITTTGVYTMWVPSEMVTSGRAMCIQVPSNWPAIAGQLRYPSDGGRSVTCHAFGPEAVGTFADERDTAAMIVVVQPS
jgi:hypothetical protein